MPADPAAGDAYARSARAPVIGAIVEYPDDYYDYSVEVTLPANATCMWTRRNRYDLVYDQSRWSIATPLQDGRWGLYDGTDRSGLFDLLRGGLGRLASDVTRQVVHSPRP